MWNWFGRCVAVANLHNFPFAFVQCQRHRNTDVIHCAFFAWNFHHQRNETKVMIELNYGIMFETRKSISRPPSERERETSSRIQQFTLNEWIAFDVYNHLLYYISIKVTCFNPFHDFHVKDEDIHFVRRLIDRIHLNQVFRLVVFWWVSISKQI